MASFYLPEDLKLVVVAMQFRNKLLFGKLLDLMIEESARTVRMQSALGSNSASHKCDSARNAEQNIGKLFKASAGTYYDIKS